MKEIRKEERETAFRDIRGKSEVTVVRDMKESESSKKSEWPKA